MPDKCFVVMYSDDHCKVEGYSFLLVHTIHKTLKSAKRQVVASNKARTKCYQSKRHHVHFQIIEFELND